MMKVVCLTLAIVFGITLLAGMWILGVNSVRYMTAQNFPLNEAIRNSWQDLVDVLPFTNSQAEQDVLVFGPTNLNIEIKGLGV